MLESYKQMESNLAVERDFTMKLKEQNKVLMEANNQLIARISVSSKDLTPRPDLSYVK